MTRQEADIARHADRLRELLERTESVIGSDGFANGAATDPDVLEPVRALALTLRQQCDELAEAQRRHEAASARFTELASLIPGSYLITTSDGRIDAVSEGAARVLGQSAESLRGTAITDLTAEADERDLLLRLRLLLENNQSAGIELVSRAIGDWTGDGTPSARDGASAGDGARVSRVACIVRAIGTDASGTHAAPDAFLWILEAASSADDQRLIAMQLLKEQAARQQAERAQRRDAFLAEASEILASSLDYETTLGSVARLAVPRVADSCTVYVAGEDDTVYRVGVAHADPEIEQRLIAEFERRPVDLERLASPIARVLRAGEAEVIPHLSDVLPLYGRTMAAAGAEITAEALMVVPLKVRERVLGAVSLGWNERTRYTPDHLWLARKLAERAALSVENARLHREARNASAAKSQFLAGMSHEFRTPLTSIVAYADMLVSGIPEPITGTPLRYADRIATAARHLTFLIDQVLTLSRFEAGKEQVREESIELAPLVQEAAALIEPLARQKGIDFTVDIGPDTGSLTTDPNKLRQVLFNLLGNAVKFTERGEVRMTIEREQDAITIEVCDTGEGIPEQHLQHIWEPFWQAPHPDGRAGGTGLGLGIVRHLVELLHGSVRVRSVEGQGTTFHVRLPA